MMTLKCALGTCSCSCMGFTFYIYPQKHVSIEPYLHYYCMLLNARVHLGVSVL